MDEVWEEKVKAYRESIKQEKPELDIALLFRILDIVNESSEVKVAIDPIGEEGDWSSNAPTYAVTGVTKLDDGRVALRAADEHHGIEAGALYNKLKKEMKRSTGEKVPVLFAKGETVTQLTDVFSHALVREQWAGMPFDLVLAVRH
ncbi:MAG: hypothetical protein IJ087_03225 [Eggerthellaceae bacterium]|nr:hypothetical protein [Eggerthellaceae bacterium]